MNVEAMRQYIESGSAILGIELGSTRIKAVLIDDNHEPIASGGFGWENRLENGVWTYHIDEVWTGLAVSYQSLKEDVMAKYGAKLTRFASIGISAMMHGYLAFDKEDNLLAPFRTWRNTITGEAAEKLTELFGFNVPQRWSISHLYQSILNGDEHVKNVAFFTTLAGYVHWKLTGRKVLGIGDASGMFPIDSLINSYDMEMVAKFDALVEGKYDWHLNEILPKGLCAGEDAGTLTAEGAKLLDVSGELEAGIPLCPPEGDAGTGMVATNSVAERTGNVSAGTSIFAMIVLEKALSKLHEEIDMVTTPAGKPVAMVHCNNCTSDLNAWVSLFAEFVKEAGMDMDANTLFGLLYRKALEGDKDCGGLVAYNYLSGEHITGMEEGRPLFARLPDANFTLANFMRTHLYAALASLKIGMEILVEEKVEIDAIFGHGGLFKTRGVGQRMLAAAINTPVAVLETAGEGGAWGIALLAAYAVKRNEGETLENYLSTRVFAGKTGETMSPDAEDCAGFAAYIERYRAALPVERAAVDTLK
ncbi:MAG: ATPase [Clostridiales bacterium]|nr:ATPase [Clostridiales bacterium]